MMTGEIENPDYYMHSEGAYGGFKETDGHLLWIGIRSA